VKPSLRPRPLAVVRCTAARSFKHLQRSATLMARELEHSERSLILSDSADQHLERWLTRTRLTMACSAEGVRGIWVNGERYGELVTSIAAGV